jgi:hypothetical protein
MNQATPLDPKPAGSTRCAAGFFLESASPLYQVFKFNPPPRSRDLGWHNK